MGGRSVPHSENRNKTFKAIQVFSSLILYVHDIHILILRSKSILKLMINEINETCYGLKYPCRYTLILLECFTPVISSMFSTCVSVSVCVPAWWYGLGALVCVSGRGLYILHTYIGMHLVSY